LKVKFRTFLIDLTENVVSIVVVFVRQILFDFVKGYSFRLEEELLRKLGFFN